MQDSVDRESYVPEPADQIAEMLRSKLSEAQPRGLQLHENTVIEEDPERENARDTEDRDASPIDQYLYRDTTQSRGTFDQKTGLVGIDDENLYELFKDTSSGAKLRLPQVGQQNDLEQDDAYGFKAS